MGLAACLPALAQSTNPLLTCTAAQVRATERYWFTGNEVAIDFGVSGSSYNITTNAATAANVYEASTVVTDGSGVLQFWVGEGVVHNRNQEPMDNGTGLTGAVELNGNYSAVQGFVAFAAAGVPGKYFVVATTGFTTPTTTPGDLYYSVVDMTANGGLGAVTATKNVLVPGSTGLASEVLTAVPTSDGLGHWVITTQYNSSNLVAIKFDDNGPVGAPVTTVLSQPIGGAFGSAYFNPQLNRLVVLSGARMSLGGSSYAFLMQFNATTGQATELAAWPVPVAGAADPNAGASGSRAAYAADFSPSGNYVYVSQIQPGRLWRYNVSSEDSTTIAASEEFVGETSTGASGGGHIRRGPDGAMWIANRGTNTTLTRIPNPDAATVAGIGFVAGNIALPAGAASSWGLPQTVGGCAPAVTPTNFNLGSGQAIPTLNEWVLMLLALAMLGMAGLHRKRGV